MNYVKIVNINPAQKYLRKNGRGPSGWITMLGKIFKDIFDYKYSLRIAKRIMEKYSSVFL